MLMKDAMNLNIKNIAKCLHFEMEEIFKIWVSDLHAVAEVASVNSLIPLWSMQGLVWSPTQCM
jgi:hypothetical protein